MSVIALVTYLSHPDEVQENYLIVTYIIPQKSFGGKGGVWEKSLPAVGTPPDTSKKPKGGKTLDMVKRGMVGWMHGRKGRIVWDSGIPAGDGNWGKREWKSY